MTSVFSLTSSSSSSSSLTSVSSSCHLRLRFQPCHRFILFVLLYLAIHVFTFESCWKCRANPATFSSASLVNVVFKKDSVEGTKSPVSSSSSYPSSAEKSRHALPLTGHPVLVYNMSSSLLRRNTQRNNGRRQQEQDTGRNACRECLFHVIFLLFFLHSCESGERQTEKEQVLKRRMPNPVVALLLLPLFIPSAFSFLSFSFGFSCRFLQRLSLKWIKSEPLTPSCYSLSFYFTSFFSIDLSVTDGVNEGQKGMNWLIPCVPHFLSPFLILFLFSSFVSFSSSFSFCVRVRASCSLHLYTNPLIFVRETKTWEKWWP